MTFYKRKQQHRCHKNTINKRGRDRLEDKNSFYITKVFYYDQQLQHKSLLYASSTKTRIIVFYCNAYESAISHSSATFTVITAITKCQTAQIEAIPPPPPEFSTYRSLLCWWVMYATCKPHPTAVYPLTGAPVNTTTSPVGLSTLHLCTAQGISVTTQTPRWVYIIS